MRTTFTRLFGLCLLLVLGATFGSIASAAERVTWYHHDLQGSPVAGTDSTGAVVWEERYKPYGRRMLEEDGGSNKLWYTGKAHEEGTRLSYFGARWYHPEIGRFMSVDPVDFQEDNVQSFNRYAYANNNPYRYIDPDGQLGVSIHAFQRGMTLDQAASVSSVGNAALYTAGSGAVAVGSLIVPDPSDLVVGAALATSSKIGGAVAKGLTTPEKYFGSKTKQEVKDALNKKYGPPKSSREHADTYYNDKTKRSYNVHEEPGHNDGKPHVDIRRRGGHEERKYDLKESN